MARPRKGIEERVQESEALYSALIRTSPDSIILSDLEGTILMANDRSAELYAYPTADEMIGQQVLQLVSPDDLPRVILGIQRVIEQGSVRDREYTLQRLDGSLFPAEISASVVRDTDGKPQAIISVARDIGQRRHAEAERRQSDARFRAIFEGAAVGIALVDKQRQILETNHALQSMLGYDEEELRGMVFSAITHPDDVAVDLERARELIEGLRDHYQYEKRYVRKDGKVVWAYVTVSLAKRVGEGPGYAVVAVEDITERKRAEKRLHEMHDQYLSIFESTSDGVIISSLDGYVVEANPAACAMHGYERKDIIGLHQTVYEHPDRHQVLSEYDHALQAGERISAKGLNVRSDGITLPVEVKGTTFIYRGEPHILAVVRDITEQVQAYELLEMRVAERTRELTTLLDVSQQVGSTLQIEPLLGLILDQLKVVVDYRGGSLLELRADGLVIVEYRGTSPREEVIGLHFPLSQIETIWESARQGQAVMISDIRGDEPTARAFREAVGSLLDGIWRYIRCWMGIPLVQKGKTIGLLSLAIDEPNFYTEGQANLALAFAAQAAAAMENAKLYAQAQEAAALEERARLARELHDSVTQALFSMTMHAEAAQVALQREGSEVGSGRVGRNLRYLSELTEGALAEMRALIFELRPGALQEEGLAAALRKHAAAVSARHGLSIEVQAPEQRVLLEPSIEEHLHRLAQEALHNVIKHSGASHTFVRLDGRMDGQLILEIEDNGSGFDSTSVPAGHLGLRTMADRVAQIGGTLEIISVPPAKGTLVRIIAPCALCAEAATRRNVLSTPIGTA